MGPTVFNEFFENVFRKREEAGWFSKDGLMEAFHSFNERGKIIKKASETLEVRNI